AGADVITFSVDKLLGGPQAGIAVGKEKAISRMRKHPLMRAVRPGKLTFAALDATFRSYLNPKTLSSHLPVWFMLESTEADMRSWVEPILPSIEKAAKEQLLDVSLRSSDAYAGGGALPTEKLESIAIAFSGSGRKLAKLQKNARHHTPSLIGYIKDGFFQLDIRTMQIESPEEVETILLHALKDMEEKNDTD
ncbi:L-seryl-tRNA(Sec) selenium transferase, partial [bacterium]|nr:L-seryl-tRNA(Sec) selenium transferase [bacterium]